MSWWPRVNFTLGCFAADLINAAFPQIDYTPVVQIPKDGAYRSEYVADGNPEELVPMAFHSFWHHCKQTECTCLEAKPTCLNSSQGTDWAMLIFKARCYWIAAAWEGMSTFGVHLYGRGHAHLRQVLAVQARTGSGDSKCHLSHLEYLNHWYINLQLL